MNNPQGTAAKLLWLPRAGVEFARDENQQGGREERKGLALALSTSSAERGVLTAIRREAQGNETGRSETRDEETRKRGRGRLHENAVRSSRRSVLIVGRKPEVRSRETRRKQQLPSQLVLFFFSFLSLPFFLVLELGCSCRRQERMVGKGPGNWEK